MAQLKIEQPNTPVYTVTIHTEETHLGRADDNTIVLQAEEVSRHHAKLYRRGDRYVLVDLNSLNGTYVNRQRVVKRVLADNDEIWFGSKCRITFRDDPPEVKAQQPKYSPTDSSLIDDIDKIRAQMESAASNLTLIGEQARRPEITPQLKQPSADELVAMGRAYRRLAVLHKASKLLASGFDLGQRLTEVLDIAMAEMEADRGFIVLREEGTDNLRVSVARSMGGPDTSSTSPSMSVAGRAALEGEPVLMTDGVDEGGFAEAQSIIRQRIESAMCVPLKVESRILGSIYVDRSASGRPWDKEDLELFASLAAQSTMAIENVRLYEQMLESEKRRAALGRFLSPAVVDHIMSHDTGFELGGKKAQVTTMFCDIRGFTTLAERMAPDQVVALVNEHFTAMVEIIFGYEGTLDKYIGDELMAVFGAPLTAPDDTERALRAALDMQARNRELNAERRAAGQPELHLGIGIETGDVIAGYIGSPRRMEFTVVGDRVNTAKRLCGLAEGGEVVAGETTYSLVKDHFIATSKGSVVLKGKEQLVRAYVITGTRG